MIGIHDFIVFALSFSSLTLPVGSGPVSAKPAPNAPQAIVIEPSRELAEQVKIKSYYPTVYIQSKCLFFAMS